jgi:hypothetical protein
LCVLWTLNLIALQEAGTCGDLPGSVTTRPTAMCLQEGQAHVLVVQSLLRMLWWALVGLRDGGPQESKAITLISCALVISFLFLNKWNQFW